MAQKTKKQILFTVIRILTIILSVIGLIWTNLTVFITVGSVIGTVIFGAVLLAAIFTRQAKSALNWLWKKKIGKAIIILASAAIITLTGFCAYFTANMIAYTHIPSENLRCVLVLGCQVRGEQPSSMLRDRVNTAIRLLNSNPEAVCVVSGGQGRGESISEAEAMRRQLTASGIDESRIICEDRSTSTDENFAFSAELIAPLNIEGKGLAIVTSDYHQFRADLIARRHGFNGAAHYSSRTGARVFLNSVIREWAALFAEHFGFSA